MFYTETPKTPKDPNKERLRRLLAPPEVKASKYLRKLSLAPAPAAGEWSGIALSGTEACRSLYLVRNEVLFAAEVEIPEDAQDYVRRPIDPQRPIDLRKQGPVMSGARDARLTLVTGPTGPYLVARARYGSSWWLTLTPLAGDPRKVALRKARKAGKKRGKRRKRSRKRPKLPECGESGLKSFLLRQDTIAVGDGDCAPLLKDGVAAANCLKLIGIPPRGPVWVLPGVGKGGGILLLAGPVMVTLKRRQAPSRVSPEVRKLMLESPSPTYDPGRKAWLAVSRKGRKIWSVGSLGQAKALPGRLSRTAAEDLVSLGVPAGKKGMVRLLRAARIVDLVEGAKSPGLYPLGKGVTALSAGWGEEGRVLLIGIKTGALYQFSVEP